MSKSFLRNVVGEYMRTLGERDDKVVIVNADLAGTCRNKSFAEKFPDRAFNVGIAEQNMISFAAGLAHEGFHPYTFSMAPFITMRACEQIRTDVAYGNRNVTMIGVYAGVSGGISGATHWGIEDVGIMTAIPNITVFEISDANQAKKILDFSLTYNKPVYIRLGVEATEDIYDEISIKPSGSFTVMDGDDGAFICSGVIVQYAVEAAKKIKTATGKSIRVLDMYSIKPIDKEAIKNAAQTGNVIIAQDHNIIGGLGTIAAAVIAEAGISTKLEILGIRDKFIPMAHAGYIYHQFSLDTKGLIIKMERMLQKVTPPHEIDNTKMQLVSQMRRAA